MAVLVTRPDERGRQLVDMLSQSGMTALHLPLFTLEEGYELVNLPTRLNQLNAGDYVFLVSKSAVDFADKILKKKIIFGEKIYISLQLENEPHSIFLVKASAMCVTLFVLKVVKAC